LQEGQLGAGEETGPELSLPTKGRNVTGSSKMSGSDLIVDTATTLAVRSSA